VGRESLTKRKTLKPEPVDFDGENPAVRVHALLGHRLLKPISPPEKRCHHLLKKLLHELMALAITKKSIFSRNFGKARVWFDGSETLLSEAEQI
jgi:hypothetical protein